MKNENLPLELFNPARAEKMLNHDAKVRAANPHIYKGSPNRVLKPGVAEQYSSDMSGGDWTRCYEAILLDELGAILNGQHRLWAIVDSGCTLRFYLALNVDREDALNTDTGNPRTVVDGARISGRDVELTARIVSASRAICEGNRGAGSKSHAAKIKQSKVWRAPAEFAASFTPRPKFLGNGIMLGAVGRAYMHEQDKEKLKRFCYVLRTGYQEGESESAAVTLRNYLIQKGSISTSPTLWAETFRKAQNAIHRFMRGKHLYKIVSVSDEVYPLPTDPNARPLKGTETRKLATIAGMKTRQRRSAQVEAVQL